MSAATDTHGKFVNVAEAGCSDISLPSDIHMLRWSRCSQEDIADVAAKEISVTMAFRTITRGSRADTNCLTRLPRVVGPYPHNDFLACREIGRSTPQSRASYSTVYTVQVLQLPLDGTVCGLLHNKKRRATEHIKGDRRAGYDFHVNKQARQVL